MTELPAGLPKIKIDEVKFYSKNSKQHPQEQIEILKTSIQKFGFNVPIILDKNNVIIAGHGRIIAAKELKMTEVTFIKKDKLTEAEAEAYRIMDNKSAESKWDNHMLREAVQRLQDKKYDLSYTGFNNGEVFCCDFIGVILQFCNG